VREVGRLFSSIFFLLSSCITTPKPIDDHALARAAINAARSVDAARHAPAYLKQAETFYSQAEQFVELKEYNKASRAFSQARLAAEKAENVSIIKRRKLGEDF
jgi:hypothetical protein